MNKLITKQNLIIALGVIVVIGIIVVIKNGRISNIKHPGYENGTGTETSNTFTPSQNYPTSNPAHLSHLQHHVSPLKKPNNPD